MLSDKFLERIFSNKEMQMLPIGYQSTAVHALQTVLEEMKEENPYESISELFSDTDV